MQQLLLLHGAIGSANQFSQLVPLLKNRYNVATINFSGHGGTLLPSDGFSIALFAKDVLNWLDNNNIKTIDIFGYSMGGYVALYLAKHCPDRVNKIFTLATKFNWTPEIAIKEASMINADKISEKVPVFAEKLQQIHGVNNWQFVLSKTAKMMLSLGENPNLDLSDLSAIKNDVLLSVGDRDTMVSLEETLTVYRNLKNSQLLVLSNTYHAFEKVNLNILTSHMINYFG